MLYSLCHRVRVGVDHLVVVCIKGSLLCGVLTLSNETKVWYITRLWKNLCVDAPVSLMPPSMLLL